MKQSRRRRAACRWVNRRVANGRRNRNSLKNQLVNRRRDTKRTRERPILLVFSDDWGRHPSSCQHLIGRLLDRYEVLWVNTIGTRVPRLDGITIRRGVEKLISWVWKGRTSTNRETNPNIRVLNPAMLPSFRSLFCRRWNKRLLCSQLGKAIREANRNGRRRVIGISTLPYTADLIGCLPVNKWVYYCVDDWSQWPGMDAQPLAEMEKELLTKADSVIAVSEALRERILTISQRPSTLLTHGFDKRFLLEELVNPSGNPLTNPSGNEEREKNEERENLLGKYPGRKIVYWGLADERLDGPIMVTLANAFPKDSFVFVGPKAQPPEIINQQKNIFWFGTVSFERLPAIARESDVLLMPYNDSSVTRQIQPLKMLEYLATGKPVIARDLPAMQNWRDCLDTARTAEEFIYWLQIRLESGLPEAQRQARERLQNQTWEQKVVEFERLILS